MTRSAFLATAAREKIAGGAQLFSRIAGARCLPLFLSARPELFQKASFVPPSNEIGHTPGIDRVAFAAQQFLRVYGSGDYFSTLINHPAPHPFRTPPRVVVARETSHVRPACTLVMPIFEQAGTIARNLETVERNAALPHDWVIIDDASADGSAEAVESYFARANKPLVSGLTILRNEAPIYETACDNMGFALASTDTIIEVQADLLVEEPAFDRVIADAFVAFPSASAISGRAGHAFPFEGTALQKLFRRQPETMGVGLLGRNFESPEEDVARLRGRIFECQTVNRGPWALRRSDLAAVGFLDEANFFLGHDDHDYHRRIFEHRGGKPLYIPMSVRSNLSEGSTRKLRTGMNDQIYWLLRRERRGAKKFNKFAGRSPRIAPREIVAQTS